MWKAIAAFFVALASALKLIPNRSQKEEAHEDSALEIARKMSRLWSEKLRPNSTKKGSNNRRMDDLVKAFNKHSDKA